MKIGLAHNLYEPYAKGGAEKLVERLIKEFTNSGHEVFLITTEPKNKKLRLNYDKDICKVYRLKSFYSYLSSFPKCLRLFWHLSNFCNPKRRIILKKIIKEEKPDLFITHNLVGLGFFLAKIIRRQKIKHEHFLHDIQLLHPSGLMISGQEKMLKNYFASLYRFFVKYNLKGLDKVISPSSWLIEEHLKFNFFKCTNIEIRPLRRVGEKKENGTEKIPGRFLFVGQVEKHKGILFLIKTWKKIKNENISLEIIGSGQDEEIAKKLAKEDERIFFSGQKNSEEVKSAMLRSSVLIVPSLCYENSPTVIYEARESGLVVLASNLGGIPEISPNPEYLFTAGNENELTEKIEKFLKK